MAGLLDAGRVREVQRAPDDRRPERMAPAMLPGGPYPRPRCEEGIAELREVR